MDSAVLDQLFAATVQATEEALVNQLVASETMTGANDVTIFAMPVDQMVQILSRHNVLIAPAQQEAKSIGRHRAAPRLKARR